MNTGKIIKFIFYSAVIALVLKSLQVVYYKYFVRDDGQVNGTAYPFRLDFKDIKIPKTNPDEKNSKTDKNKTDKSEICQAPYNFENMLALIEACEKVKYLDYLRFSRPQEACQINQGTLQALVKAVHDEKSRLKHHIADLKSCSKDNIPSKRIKALKYYLRVMELNLQDLKGIAANKK
jgi:hypothetical protein